MNIIRTTLVPVAAAVALLAGCASGVKLDENANAPVESRNATGNQGAGTSQSQVATVDLSKNQQATSAPRIVYFDFDSYVVKDEYRNIVESNASALKANKAKRISIEGHTDERGGREYNLALGQKRAEAVAKQLALLGASDSQMEAVSFGKERPAATGSDESAWAQNRRAELKDK